jgi:L-ascorbate metabolism protein UlaG (beta-lactamase superfamily)
VVRKILTGGRRKSPIRKSSSRVEKASDDDILARRVGLRPSNGWHRRNFFLEVLLPSLFTTRTGSHRPPIFPQLHQGQVCITWIGHASFLIQTPKLNILVDPNWSNWLKIVKRLKHPGIHIKDLPAIDLVLVTHAHFDHLDKKTLKAVAADQPIIVPYEVGNLVHKLGFKHVEELHYWESAEHEDLRVTLTPAQHWGARVLHDQHRGFGGYILETHGRTIYHCGDSAWFEGFGDIGKKFDIDVALLPIGSYDPPSGREVHMNPEQALDAFDQLGAKFLVPMHYGSFPLSFEPLHEPLDRFLRAVQDRGMGEEVCVVEEGVPQVF